MEDSSVGTFECQCKGEFRSACYGAAKHEHGNERYCILHLPSEDKGDDFKAAVTNNLEQDDFDFRGTFFPSGTSEFRDRKFSASVNFVEATFYGNANFGGAQFDNFSTDFSEARFTGEGTYFTDAQFSGVETDFSGAQFSSVETGFAGTQFSSVQTSFARVQFGSARTYFAEAQFSGEETDFYRAQFSGGMTFFYGAQFNSERTIFTLATFKESVAFLGTALNTVFDAQLLVRFDHCRIDRPELLTFNTVLLRLAWFVNVDVRKVDFTDVKWYGLTDGPKGNLEGEIEALEQPVGSPYTLLAQVCQRLAANAEESRNYAHASIFNYWAMDAQRKSKWGAVFAPWRLIWWYWALSGYGERTRRSAIWLVGILVGFAVLYMLPFVGYVQVQELSLSGIWQAFSQAIVYSLGVMSRQAERLTGYESTLLQSFVFIEGILGPLQVALFALALRRRFMRGKG